jgi:hypothetical protein
VTNLVRKIRNVIVCEDIRDEIRNKKSLIGVFPGDILVAEFPATIQFAIYMEYTPDADDGDQLSIEFRLLQDDTEMAKAKGITPIIHGQNAVLAIPRGVGLFEKETKFRLCISVNGEPETEIMSKRIIKATTTIS